MIPTAAHRHHWHGHTYYCYNDVWYRPYNGHYVVCRPPFGTILAAELIAGMTWLPVRIAYYHTLSRTYDRISDNNRYIIEQNEIIARNNALIAAQNNAIAGRTLYAQDAYSRAGELGLIQSYASASGSYFYQDGVFYTVDALGRYTVIAPPAGALVETLPEDYDVVILKGMEYYQVDNTIYRLTVIEGKPYFEVVGQLYL